MKIVNKIFMVLVYVAAIILIGCIGVMAYNLIRGYGFDPTAEAWTVMIICIVIDSIAMFVYNIIPEAKFIRNYFKGTKG